ncbi:hypothetical protein [Absidia glauca]|uniref:HSF-type DNA-binding domain-containing protein n=1 Tax=Absidia glauca TaxID=4829 RepID=A0A163JJI3_ABSGL|nr:hypothetical protein [Absidia glauca]
MNYQDYVSVPKQQQSTTNNNSNNASTNVYYQPGVGSPFTISPESTSALSTLEPSNSGYIITHQNTPSVVTYSTNASDTTTIIDTSSYSFPSSSGHMYQQHAHHHNNHHHQQHHFQQQQQEENDLMVPLPERGVAGFVCKLYQSLDASDGGEKYARWMKHNGKDMFVIDCIPKFTETVLPKLFKHCKFASFVRQLNIYGFQRDTDARKSKDSRDKEICRWYHTHFRPGRRDLFHLIRRKAPRYSRRKRIKMEQQEDDKTGTTNSGDESDQEHGDNHTLHQVSPSATSTATTPTMTNNNINVVYCSSPSSSMFREPHGLIDTSPMMLSPPLLPSSSSSTAIVSTSPPLPPPTPPSQQQHQQRSCDESSSSALHIPVQLKQEPNDSPSLSLPLQPHQQQEHPDLLHQQSQDHHTILHPHQHEPSSSMPLDLDMNTTVMHGNTSTDFEGFIKEPSHKPHEDHSLQQSQQFEQQLHQLQQQQQFQHLQQQQQQHILPFEQDPSMYNIMLQVSPPPPPPPSASTSSSSPSFLYQEKLKAHISRLQHDYQQMHTYFTTELGKAHKQIEIQRLRREFLERSLRGDR